MYGQTNSGKTFTMQGNNIQNMSGQNKSKSKNK